jgi:hypothetical protein
MRQAILDGCFDAFTSDWAYSLIIKGEAE